MLNIYPTQVLNLWLRSTVFNFSSENPLPERFISRERQYAVAEPNLRHTKQKRFLLNTHQQA